MPNTERDGGLWLSDSDFQDLFEEANRNEVVKAGILTEANRVLQRARRIDREENEGKGNVRLEEGYYENGRYYVHVVSDDVDGEYGNASTPRRATLRRARG